MSARIRNPNSRTPALPLNLQRRTRAGHPPKHLRLTSQFKRAQIKELQAAASTRATEASASQARNAEVEDALAKALARLQSADVVAEANQRTIADLEVSKKDISAENQELKSKVSLFHFILIILLTESTGRFLGSRGRYREQREGHCFEIACCPAGEV